MERPNPHLMPVYNELNIHLYPYDDPETRLLKTSHFVTVFVHIHLFGQPPQDDFLYMVHEALGQFLPPENPNLPSDAAHAVAIYALMYLERVVIACKGCHKDDRFKLFFGAFAVAWQEFCHIQVPDDIWMGAFPVRAGKDFFFQEMKNVVTMYLNLPGAGGLYIDPWVATNFCRNLPIISTRILGLPTTEGRIFISSRM